MEASESEDASEDTQPSNTNDTTSDKMDTSESSTCNSKHSPNDSSQDHKDHPPSPPCISDPNSSHHLDGLKCPGEKHSLQKPQSIVDTVKHHLQPSSSSSPINISKQNQTTPTTNPSTTPTTIPLATPIDIIPSLPPDSTTHPHCTQLPNYLFSRRISLDPYITHPSYKRQLYSLPSLAQRMTLERRLKEHEGCVNCINFSWGGNLLASGSDDLQVVLWDWASGRLMGKFDSGHVANVFQVNDVQW